MEDYGLNEAISYANLMIILFVCINLIHFRAQGKHSPPQMILGELGKNNSRIQNKNIRAIMKGVKAKAVGRLHPLPLFTIRSLHRDYPQFQRG